MNAVDTSLNVYHTYLRPGFDNDELLRFIPHPKEVARVYRKYKSVLGARELPMNCVNKQYCSATLAVLNNGYVSPCATIREEKAECNLKFNGFKNIVENNKAYLNFKYFKNRNNLPETCKKCKMNDSCWGCRSRSYASREGIYGVDPRCFRNKSEKEINLV